MTPREKIARLKRDADRKAERIADHAEYKRLARKYRKAAGLSLALVGETLGVSATRVHKKENEEHDYNFTGAEHRRLCQIYPGFEEATRPGPEISAPAPSVRLAGAHVAEKGTRLAAIVVRAMEDGRITPSELEDIITGAVDVRTGISSLVARARVGVVA